MDKNQYFYEYQTALTRACEETRIRKNKVPLVQFFQDHWTENIDKISAVDFLKNAIATICVEKPRGRKKK